MSTDWRNRDRGGGVVLRNTSHQKSPNEHTLCIIHHGANVRLERSAFGSATFRIAKSSIADFNIKTNVLLSFFYNVSTSCLYKIFISICRPMSLYGSQIWDVSHRYNNKFCL